MAESEPEKEAEAAAALVGSARRVVVTFPIGEDPVILGAEQFMFWELQAGFLRCADIVAGEE